jgi:hypothetical protein
LRRLFHQRLRVLQLSLYPMEDPLGNGEQSCVDRLTIALCGSENVNLARNAPTMPKHCRIEVTEDRFNACLDSDVAQGGNQNRGSRAQLLLIAPAQYPVVETEPGALPDRWCTEMHVFWKRIRKKSR